MIAIITLSLLVSFNSCLSGPDVVIEETCDWADVNNDLRVDLRDFAWLQNLWKCPIPEGCE